MFVFQFFVFYNYRFTAGPINKINDVRCYFIISTLIHLCNYKYFFEGKVKSRTPDGVKQTSICFTHNFLWLSALLCLPNIYDFPTFDSRTFSATRIEYQTHGPKKHKGYLCDSSTVRMLSISINFELRTNIFVFYFFKFNNFDRLHMSSRYTKCFQMLKLINPRIFITFLISFTRLMRIIETKKHLYVVHLHFGGMLRDTRDKRKCFVASGSQA